MSSRENLLRLIERLPEDRLVELEQLVISMLPADAAIGRPRELDMSFDDALAQANKTIGKTLKKLSQ